MHFQEQPPFADFGFIRHYFRRLFPRERVFIMSSNYVNNCEDPLYHNALPGPFSLTYPANLQRTSDVSTTHSKYRSYAIAWSAPPQKLTMRFSNNCVWCTTITSQWYMDHVVWQHSSLFSVLQNFSRYNCCLTSISPNSIMICSVSAWVQHIFNLSTEGYNLSDFVQTIRKVIMAVCITLYRSA